MNILRKIARKANLNGHIWHCNCLLKHLNEGKIKETQIRGRRLTQLLNGLQETRNALSKGLDCGENMNLS